MVVSVYAVIETRYGAVQRPESVHEELDDAIDEARDLAGGADYKDVSDSDGFTCEGYTTSGTEIYEVLEYELQ